MEQIKKMKVAMICHMSNSQVRSHLPLIRQDFLCGLKRLIGLSPLWYVDLAMWNQNIADYLSQRKDVDFYIIAPHSGMKKMRVAYKDNNVNYVFLNQHWAGLLKRFVRSKKRWLRINPLAKAVKREIERIAPDIVVLQGTENPYYSSTVLGITKYPVYAMCQTVYNNPDRRKYGMWKSENVETELDLFRELKYFGVYCKLHYDLVRQFSPHSFILKFGYPKTGELLEPIETKKVFDFVNFALTMDARKGFPDAIQAIAIVKKKYPKIRLNLIGQCTEEKMAELITMIEHLGLQENVVFTPFFEKQTDLFLHIQKSRFAVLPCKVDNISGTMMQAMQLGLPIVVYKTTGTPSFNREKQCALIAEKENVDELAQHMLSLMENPVLADELKKNAIEWQEQKYEAEKHNGDHIVDSFMAIIANFRNGTEIPQSLLFNPDSVD